VSELCAEDDSSGSCEQPSPERLRWRSWPCPNCRGSITPLGHLLAGIASGEVVSTGSPEEIAVSQIASLRKWIDSCAHCDPSEKSLPKLAEGSEHKVYLHADSATVFKVTRLAIYGESYYLDAAGKINQKNCSPLEYLIRLRHWKKLFQSAPRDLGMTNQGQIVSSQEFISGRKPTQQAVDSFLFEAGLSPVRQEFWLWNRTYPEYEIWLGDGRDDNFVETQAGIVPIDIRLWFSSPAPSDVSTDW
jgi:hypothetical protein